MRGCDALVSHPHGSWWAGILHRTPISSTPPGLLVQGPEPGDRDVGGSSPAGGGFMVL